MSFSRISIFVPIRNEEKILASFLQDLESIFVDKDRFEIWLCDGRSTDSSASLIKEAAEKKGWNFHQASQQVSSIGGLLKEVAPCFHADYVLILPSDCCISQKALAQLFHHLEKKPLWGGFTKTYRPSSLLLNIYAWLQGWTLTHQSHLVWTNGIFLTTDSLRSWIPPVEGFLEDVQLSDYLRSKEKALVISQGFSVNARRYLSSGILKQILKNALIIFAYRWRLVPIAKLKRFYYNKKV